MLAPQSAPISVKLLFWRNSVSSASNWPNMAGDPVNWFSDRSRARRMVNRPNSVGMVPVRLLALTSRLTSLDSCPISLGIVPWSSFLETRSRPRLRIRPTSVGMVPVRKLCDRSSVSLAVWLPISVGMDPDNRLPLARKNCNCKKFPMAVGMVPSSWLLETSMPSMEKGSVSRRDSNRPVRFLFSPRWMTRICPPSPANPGTAPRRVLLERLSKNN
mmetsp:Transcript_24378/g.41406  ORF Transcript_24378/g.41406 Transcript_24378/m.41406 type:complete len:216 (+) Transcript_24378:179-826(+)